VKPAGNLVDTSVWVDFFRGVASIKELVMKLLARDRIFTAGPSREPRINPRKKRGVKGLSQFSGDHP
jgi:hypothetical protein